jgi:predicted DNA-binding transcriptional regulator AlpA
MPKLNGTVVVSSNELAAALDENEVARVIGVRVKTLRNWRVQGIGPRFVRTGRKLVRYRPSDVLDWQEANLRRSTSEGAR